MKRSVMVKMVEDKDFQPTLKFANKVWVHLPGGEYFYIHQGHVGQWYQSFALYMDYPSEHAAVEAGLAHILHPNVYGPEKYKALRVRERCFTPDIPSVKQALRELRCEKRKRLSLKAKRNVPRGTIYGTQTKTRLHPRPRTPAAKARLAR